MIYARKKISSPFIIATGEIIDRNIPSALNPVMACAMKPGRKLPSIINPPITLTSVMLNDEKGTPDFAILKKRIAAIIMSVIDSKAVNPFLRYAFLAAATTVLPSIVISSPFASLPTYMYCETRYIKVSTPLKIAASMQSIPITKLPFFIFDIICSLFIKTSTGKNSITLFCNPGYSSFRDMIISLYFMIVNRKLSINDKLLSRNDVNVRTCAKENRPYLHTVIVYSLG